ncbi:MAG: hypothetical protein V2I36_17880 [Desulfopila sp.]|jgi:hypothetical protein|nr:hypothetical protein [Desulfopila sp.]
MNVKEEAVFMEKEYGAACTVSATMLFFVSPHRRVNDPGCEAGSQVSNTFFIFLLYDIFAGVGHYALCITIVKLGIWKGDSFG